MVRPTVRGKFLFVGDQKFYVKGVTYGPFKPDANGNEYPEGELVERDLRRIATSGFNSVRVYTVPPRSFLDAAERQGLRVLVGLPWEEHVTFLDDPSVVRRIESSVRESVRQCVRHPAVLAYAVGNEIPATIVRWHGARAIERFVARLGGIVKAEDPDALVTYVNYPTTGYLRVPSADFVSFNVYLESQDSLSRYLSSLQTAAGDRPLLIAEIGMDSLRNGEDVQARTLDWQIRKVFSSGSAGAFLFSWTDNWHRGGQDVTDWAFGLTDREGRPKPALEVVRRAFATVPFLNGTAWPRISVVVCTYNGGRTIRECLVHLTRLKYPNYEVIVVNDGSRDSAPQIASEFPVKLISLENGGLSNARNVGLQNATGEIVAYIDDDAYPDEHWLYYLAHAFLTTSHAGVGGPNLGVPSDGLVAQCIDNSPGGPNHVLRSDEEAELIPGCNMAFRKSVLESVGGFDTTFRIAGDDVDICWQIQKAGWTLGFHPGAVVWHHRRGSLKAYLKQQHNYGRAEALLQAKWPDKYNHFGHVAWRGRIYGKGSTLPLSLKRWRVYHGVWGSEPFQSLYHRNPGLLLSLPLMPEWYLLVLLLCAASICGLIWDHMLLAVPFLLLALAAPTIQAIVTAANASCNAMPCSFKLRWARRIVIAAMHLAQPAARLLGRLSLTARLLRPAASTPLLIPYPRTSAGWSEKWIGREERLTALEADMARKGATCWRGGPYDRWDLEAPGGLFGRVRLLMAVEEHGGGRQMVKLRTWPRVPLGVASLLVVLATCGVAAGLLQAWAAFVLLSALTLLVLVRTVGDCCAATWLCVEAMKLQPNMDPSP